MTRIHASEMASKPMGFILLADDERDEFYALSEAQRGYFLHWLRSNPSYSDQWDKAMRKAKEQRP